MLGKPLHTDTNIDTAASAKVTIVFGDISAYWVRDVEGVTLKVLDELYAANGQIAYRVHARTDGDIVDASAIKTGKQAT